jgi:hypothetical protein
VPVIINLTGQRFDSLTVVGRSSNRASDGQILWNCICDCGKPCERTGYYLKAERPKRGHTCGDDFTHSDGKKHRNIKDLTGRRFGLLKVLKATDNRTRRHVNWLCVCDCGRTCEKSGHYLQFGVSLSGKKCGRDCPASRRVVRLGGRKPGRKLKYPPMPVNPPVEVGVMFGRYAPIIRRPKQNDSELEDLQTDRLLRSCWIIHYRRQQGEEITDLHEARYINKALRGCELELRWKRRVYNGTSNSIGIVMTDVTPPEKPVIETQAENMLPIRRHRLSFKRC